MQDEKADGDYGLILNGHSLVSTGTVVWAEEPAQAAKTSFWMMMSWLAGWCLCWNWKSDGLGLVPGVCAGQVPAGAAEDGVLVPDGDLLQGHAAAEGQGGPAGQEVQAGRHASDRRRS